MRNTGECFLILYSCFFELYPRRPKRNSKIHIKSLLTFRRQGSFLFWAKGSVQFWPKGANQPDSRVIRPGFPVSGIFLNVAILSPPQIVVLSMGLNLYIIISINYYFLNLFPIHGHRFKSECEIQCPIFTIDSFDKPKPPISTSAFRNNGTIFTAKPSVRR